MLHHHFDEKGNFGVTSSFWDVVFGTDLKVRVAAAPRRRENGGLPAVTTSFRLMRFNRAVHGPIPLLLLCR